MKAKFYLQIKRELIRAGYKYEIRWQRDLKPCIEPEIFRDECIWVILNSGMKEQIARMIWNKIKFAISEGIDISDVFGHKGKVAAIKHILEHYERLFDEYTVSKDKVEYLQKLPFIGNITKWHLAKNLGHDVVKPDRHLVRIAKNYGFIDCNMMCRAISTDTGDRVSLIDLVLWRAANLGMI